MCFAECAMTLAWCFTEQQWTMAKKRKIILWLIHSTPPCLSAVTKVVYYHYPHCMIINMYWGISPSCKAPTGCDRPKTNYVSAPTRNNSRQRCTPPWHQPSTARDVRWVFVLARTSTHFILASVNFFCLLQFVHHKTHWSTPIQGRRYYLWGSSLF